MPPGLSHYYVVCPQEQKLPVLRALVKRELGVEGLAASGGLTSGNSRADARALVFGIGTRALEQIAASLDVALGGEGQDLEDISGEESTRPPLAECLREELSLNRRVSQSPACPPTM